MNTWTTDELEKINASDELELSTIGQDDQLRNPVTIWVVRLGNDLYIRAVKGPTGLWYRHALERHIGHIEAGGVKKDVTFVEADKESKDDIDTIYKSKYSRYGDKIVGSTLTPQAQEATLKLIPR
jgi:hypothetical protein